MRTAALVLLVSVAVAACAGRGGTTSMPAGSAAEAGATTGPAVRLSSPDVPVGPTERATVVWVVDGDTLVIDRGRGHERLRYIGIDAPESVKQGAPVEFMGKEAAAANATLVQGRELTLETDTSDIDRYGRLLRYVWVEDREVPGTLRMVNAALVATGYAEAVAYPPDVRHQAVLDAAEDVARAQGLGMWGEPTPAPVP